MNESQKNSLTLSGEGEDVSAAQFEETMILHRNGNIFRSFSLAETKQKQLENLNYII